MASLGWLASLCAAFTWSFSVIMFRRLGVGRSATWLNLFKGSVALVCFGVSGFVWGSFETVSVKAGLILALSGVIGVFIGDSAFFVALQRIGGTLTSAIQCLAPALTAVMAWIFLDESLKLTQIMGLLVTSVSLALLILGESRRHNSLAEFQVEQAQNFKIGVFWAALAAICQATGAVIARPMIDGMSPIVSASLRLWAPVVLLLGWEIRKNRGISRTMRSLVEGRGLIALAMASFAGTFIGLILMMYGMAHAPLGVALALNSTYPIWILIFESATKKSTLDLRTYILVISSVSGIWLMI